MSSAKLGVAGTDEARNAKDFTKSADPASDPAPAQRVLDTAREATLFSMNKANVQLALLKLARLLDGDEIPYALVGALALAEYGYHRVTVDIDILLSEEGLAAFKARHLGLGYVEKFPGSRGLRDTEYDVPIDVILAGGFPGDGKPKPVRFPEPAAVAIRREPLSMLPLPRLIELKLASGMSAPHRLKDLADVLELVRAAELDESLADELDESVRGKYRELWQAAQTRDPE
jgi:hypothetical protein